ncbi:hypothetical protein [Methanobrevibacter sp.]|uniref:hypothetical protein n=1 Tax=Methanobrevibacter sp. TaxID=66852 RepID=UPI00388ED110
MDKLKTRILLISLLLVLLLSLQGVSAVTDDNENLASESIDLSICDNTDDVSSDKLSAAYEPNDQDEALSDNLDTSTYSGLASEIANGRGTVVLQHDYYTYDEGSTITISDNIRTLDGNGAVIDMAGSNIRAFNVNSVNEVTIKNLTIKKC